MSAAEHEDELARIDREWDRERERYMVRRRHGRRYVPSATAGVVMGLLGVGIGLFWAVTTLNLGGGLGGAFSLFGVLFACLAAGLGVHQFNRAMRYRAAHAAYQRRRAAARGRPAGRDGASRLP